MTLTRVPFNAITGSGANEVWALGPSGTYARLANNWAAETDTANPAGDLRGVWIRPNDYWIVGQNGDVYPFGDAKFYGSTGGIALNRPIVTAASSRKT